MPKPKKPQDKIETEPGTDKRLADILKRALNTPPFHKQVKSTKPAQKRASRD